MITSPYCLCRLTYDYTIRQDYVRLNIAIAGHVDDGDAPCLRVISAVRVSQRGNVKHRRFHVTTESLQ